MIPKKENLRSPLKCFCSLSLFLDNRSRVFYKICSKKINKTPSKKKTYHGVPFSSKSQTEKFSTILRETTLATTACNFTIKKLSQRHFPGNAKIVPLPKIIELLLIRASRWSDVELRKLREDMSLTKGSFIQHVRKISEKLTFLTPWYTNVRARIRG